MVSTTILPGNWPLVDGCSYSNWSMPECIFRTEMVRPFSWECSQRTVFYELIIILDLLPYLLEMCFSEGIWVFLPYKSCSCASYHRQCDSIHTHEHNLQWNTTQVHMLQTLKEMSFYKHPTDFISWLSYYEFLFMSPILSWMGRLPQKCSCRHSILQGIHHFYKIQLTKKVFSTVQWWWMKGHSYWLAVSGSDEQIWPYVETKRTIVSQTDVRLDLMDTKLNDTVVKPHNVSAVGNNSSN